MNLLRLRLLSYPYDGRLFAAHPVQAQNKILRGYIKDALSNERVPFASISFMRSNNGKLSDSAGNFAFRFDEWPSDTLIVTYVGYKDFKFLLEAISYQKQLTAGLTLLSISIAAKLFRKWW